MKGADGHDRDHYDQPTSQNQSVLFCCSGNEYQTARRARVNTGCGALLLC